MFELEVGQMGQNVRNPNDFVPFELFLVWLSEAQKRPKSEQNRLDFGYGLKSEQFDNLTKVVSPKSELVRILALYCI